MRVALIDPFFDVSHRYWAHFVRDYSQHEIKIFSQSAHHWKWKMVASGIDMAHTINQEKQSFDLFLTTDFLHLSLFKSLLSPEHQHTPICHYFHENQITYPWSPDDVDPQLQRDHHYGFINYTSALVADQIAFNSRYHRDSFIDSLPSFLSKFPKSAHDHSEKLRAKSSVLSIGINSSTYQRPKETNKNNIPTILWNHRWEADKNPDDFAEALDYLASQNHDFRLILCGKQYKKMPAVYDRIIDTHHERITHLGYAASRAEYIKLLHQSNILLVTSRQDFFGISIVEAIAAGVYPILPHRLAYPEHIPLEHRQKHLYTTEAEMYQLLIKSIQTHPNLPDCSRYVDQYESQKIIGEYDALMENMANIDL